MILLCLLRLALDLMMMNALLHIEVREYGVCR